MSPPVRPELPPSFPPSSTRFSWARLRTLTARALRLRCPNCGGGPVRASWLKRLPGCPVCGLRLDRGENDYFIGAYLLNLIVAEVLLFVGLLGVVALTWPDPPWDAIQYGGIALMIVAPLVLFAACQREGPAERTGRSIDRGLDRMTR